VSYIWTLLLLSFQLSFCGTQIVLQNLFTWPNVLLVENHPLLLLLSNGVISSDICSLKETGLTHANFKVDLQLNS